jgi:hypothetical protein
MIQISLSQAAELANHELGIDISNSMGIIEREMANIGERIAEKLEIECGSCAIEGEEFGGAILTFTGSGKCPKVLQDYDPDGQLE